MPFGDSANWQRETAEDFLHVCASGEVGNFHPDRSRISQDLPRVARTLYAIGDVGSWRGDDNINSDVDYTVFGTDKEAARLFVEQYLNPMTLERIAGPRLGTFAQKLKYGRVVVLDIKEDFAVVVTPEGSEAEAKVFETREART